MKNKDLEEELTKQVDNKEAKYIRTGCDLLNILLGGKKGCLWDTSWNDFRNLG